MTDLALGGRHLLGWQRSRQGAFGLLLHRLDTATRRYLRNRRGERELRALADAHLRDLGITRGDIARVAWHGDAGHAA